MFDRSVGHLHVVLRRPDARRRQPVQAGLVHVARDYVLGLRHLSGHTIE